MKETPLYNNHVELGGKIVDFGGWALPIQYSSIKEEHFAVRERLGIFDVSHMGEVLIEGNQAEEAVQYLVTNDVKALKDNQIHYTMMCYVDGGIVDDLLVYKYNANKYFLVINASNIEKDYAHMLEVLSKFEVTITNISDDCAQIAVQGPLAQQALQKAVDVDLDDIKFFYFNDQVTIEGANCIVSRTGYTGEDGFEIYLNKNDASKVYNKVLEVGIEDGITPCGLGARDTLRFEACLPLYGHELSKDINPIEASLKFFTKLDNDDFVGKQAIVDYIEDGVTRRIVGLEMIDKGIPRAEYEVFSGDEKIGFVTTGSNSPTLKKNIALALLDKRFTKIGTEVEIQVRKKRLKAVVVKKPFYKKQYNK